MILTLFWAIFLISAALIAIGIIYSREWSGMAFIGFTFLFLLSLVILNNTLEYQIGSNITSSYSYNENLTVTGTSQQITDNYATWSDSNSHTIGYTLAIVSAIGALSSFLNTVKTWRSKK